jgi:hypothetical protein
MSSKFEYRASLGETPLPKILATIHRYRVPGVLTATLKPAVKKIYLDDGKIIFATSNDLDDALGRYLVRRGAITPQQLEQSLGNMEASGQRLGQVLVDMKILTPAQMAAAVVGQVAAILWSIFDWEEGDVTFEVGRFKAEEKIQVDLPIARVIREGLMKVADPRILVRRIGQSWTILERVPGAEPGIELEMEEELCLGLVDGKTPFGELCKMGPGETVKNARLFALLFCLDLVRTRGEPSAKKLQWRTRGGSSG